MPSTVESNKKANKAAVDQAVYITDCNFIARSTPYIKLVEIVMKISAIEKF